MTNSFSVYFLIFLSPCSLRFANLVKLHLPEVFSFIWCDVRLQKRQIEGNLQLSFWMSLKPVTEKDEVSPLASGWRFCLQCRRRGFNPWVRKIPGGRHGNPFQYSYLENPMDRRAWWASDHGSQNWIHVKRQSTAQHMGKYEQKQVQWVLLVQDLFYSTFTPFQSASGPKPLSEAWLRAQGSSYTAGKVLHRLFAERPAFTHAPMCPQHGGVSVALNGTVPLPIQNFPPRKLLPSSFHNTKVLSL